MTKRGFLRATPGRLLMTSFCLSWAATAGAQVQPPRDARPPAQIAAPKGTAAIAGVVTVSGSGAPARGARVNISGTDTFPGHSTTTDEMGRFSFTGLPAGRYGLSAAKPGYIAASYGQLRPGRSGTQIQLGDGEQFSAKLQIYKGGVLTGTILDERGEAIPRTQVRVMRYMTQGGGRTLQSSGSGSTDDRGIYRVFGLQPGDYIVSAMAQNNDAVVESQRMFEEYTRLSRARPMEDSQARVIAARLAALQAQIAEQPQPTGYAPVYYPGTTSPAEAVTVPLAPSEEKSGLDFQLQRVPIARVEGTLVNSTGLALPNIQLSLAVSGNSLAGLDNNSTRPSADGRFVFSNVAPGQYTIVAVARQNSGPMPPPPPGAQGRAAMVRPEPMNYYGMTPIAVDGRSLTNVIVSLLPGMTVSGMVKFDGATQQPPADLSRLRVSLSRSDAGTSNIARLMNGSMGARVDDSGKFTIIGVLPGQYRLSAGGAGTGWYLASSVVDGQNTLDAPIEIKANQVVSGAVVTFTDRQTELSGTLTNQRGEAAPEFTIVVYPADQRYWMPGSMRIRTSRPATDGKFTVTGLPPGDYRIAPVSDVEPGAWYDPAFLQQLDAGALRITLSDGEKKVQSLRITTGGF